MSPVLFIEAAKYGQLYEDTYIVRVSKLVFLEDV